MTTQKSLFWQVHCNVLSNCDVGQKHEFFDEFISISTFILPAIRWQPILIQLE